MDMKKLFKYILIAGIFFTTTSCEKLLESDPIISIDADDALTSREGFETATVGAYAGLRSTAQYGEALVVYPEMLGNTATHSGRGTTLLNLSNNARGSHMSTWQTGYAAIAQINIILDALAEFEADQAWKNSVAGQLHFLRALYFHNMAKVYGYDPTAIGSTNRGTVPLNLKGTPSLEEIEHLPRATQEEMYTQLYADLEAAYTELEGTSANRAPHFVTQGAVAAFFTRVALYNGDYEKVISMADSALNSGVGKFSTTTSYVSDWRQDTHPESMFEVEFKVDQNVGVNNAPRAHFTNRASIDTDEPHGRGNAMVSDDLFALYQENDVRRGLIMKGVGDAVEDNQMTKFMGQSDNLNTDNIPVIRISEVYLNRAEAYARTGQNDLAMDDINKIRERAGLQPVSGLSEDNLVDEVLLQRKLELAFEGHSFFDYKRLGLDIDKPTGRVFPFSDYRVLARIPWREFNANKQLSQNRGY